MPKWHTLFSPYPCTFFGLSSYHFTVPSLLIGIATLAPDLYSATCDSFPFSLLINIFTFRILTASILVVFPVLPSLTYPQHIIIAYHAYFLVILIAKQPLNFCLVHCFALLWRIDCPAHVPNELQYFFPFAVGCQAVIPVLVKVLNDFCL